MGDQDNHVILSDEDGNETTFDYLMSIDYENREYVVLAPLEPSEDEPELDGDEVVILRVEEDPSGGYIYVTIDNNKELDDIFDAFCQIIQDEETKEP